MFLALGALGLWACDDGEPPAGDPTPVDGAAADQAVDGGAADEGVAPVDAAFIIDAQVELGEPEPLPAPPVATAVQEGRFATSLVCALCHSNTAAASAMRDAQDRAIGPFNIWQGSMMANAARDPLWRATMSAETATTPLAKEFIESKCLSCHSPAGWREAEQKDASMLLAANKVGMLARDGANCTTCHQIRPDNLGTEESFDGGWEIHEERRIFGPHRDPATGPMINHTGYTPTLGNHVLDSALCGTCHVLQTPTMTAEARPTGHTLVEQATYLEWRNSSYPDDETTCQACHMPQFDEDGVPTRTYIARSPPGGDFIGLDRREPFGRHLLVGGNTLMPQVLRDFREQLSSMATAEAFNANIEAARQMLTTGADVQIGEPVVEGDKIRVPVTLINQVGHKLPTGFPSRRVWLRVTALDAAGAVLFDSGGFNDQGRILAEGRVLPIERHSGPTMPHRQVISRPDQVQIYSSIMCDPDGKPTWRLLRGASYCKDNRILPLGWTNAHRDAERTLPMGVEGDPDFMAGSDTTEYLLPAGTAKVVAVVLHQVLDPRFAEELFIVDTPEIRALRYYLDRVDQRPETMARASRDL
ncbi:MAG: hypothetical protein KC613_10040 [Myxococcales bacterium]|nr:hypothetical protein [Myxococcales bacterium]